MQMWCDTGRPMSWREYLRRRIIYAQQVLLILLCLCGLSAPLLAQAADKRCLYISSYHPGYEWSDGIERGMQATLQGQCELQRFYMDTKRHTDAAWAKKKAVEALALIDRAHAFVRAAFLSRKSQQASTPTKTYAPCFIAG